MKRIGWALLSGLMLSLPVQAASFDCTKAGTKVEKMICANDRISRLDDDLELAYLRALERTVDGQKVTQAQRQWLKKVRNACRDEDCLIKAYVFRERDLGAIPTKKCYWLEPPKKDSSGKRPPVEPICRAVEENLNQFCDQPPMACGLKIAPQFKNKFIFPDWKPIDKEVTPAMVEEFLRAPYEDSYPKDREAIWNEERPKMEAAFAEKRLSFSKAELDLYNLGKVQTAYRLDYGSCQANNPQLNNKEEWDSPIMPAPVKTQFAADILRQILNEHFSMDGYLHEVFLFNGNTYSYVMGGHEKPGSGRRENWVNINKHEIKIFKSGDKPTLLMKNICIFNYQPVSGVE